LSTPIKAASATSTTVTIALASLASNSGLTTGVESDAVDNTTNLYLDYLIAGKITTGTSPTAGVIEVHVVGISDDTTWPDVFDGTGSAETVTSSDIKNSICKPVAVMTTDATSNRAYPFGPVSVANLFGSTLPSKFVVFVTHSTVAALNATGANHAIYLTGKYATSG
jgi:hypothetical protein